MEQHLWQDVHHITKHSQMHAHVDQDLPKLVLPLNTTTHDVNCKYMDLVKEHVSLTGFLIDRAVLLLKICQV